MSVNFSVPERIIDTSVSTSVFVFVARVLLKEAKTVLGDLFQLIEFFIHWWIHIKNVLADPGSGVPEPVAE
jgi:hypothetical protein